jgi:putative hydrolase of the HAD superfamily
MNRREIRAVFFDAVGTLLWPEPPAADIYAAVGRRYGSRWSPAEVATRFAAAWRREEDHDRAAGWRTDEARERQRWQRIVAAVLDDTADPAACFEELYDHFRQPQAWRCDPDAAATLAELAARGLRLGLASNNDARLHGVVTGLPQLTGLGPRLVSSEIGWRKPAPAFFAAVARAAGLPPGQILYVGDDPECDHAAARAAGLQAVLLDRRASGYAPGDGCAVRLADILRWLK